MKTIFLFISTLLVAVHSKAEWTEKTPYPSCFVFPYEPINYLEELGFMEFLLSKDLRFNTVLDVNWIWDYYEKSDGITTNETLYKVKFFATSLRHQKDHYICTVTVQYSEEHGEKMYSLVDFRYQDYKCDMEKKIDDIDCPKFPSCDGVYDSMVDDLFYGSNVVGFMSKVGYDIGTVRTVSVYTEYMYKFFKVNFYAVDFQNPDLFVNCTVEMKIQKEATSCWDKNSDPSYENLNCDYSKFIVPDCGPGQNHHTDTDSSFNNL